MKKGILLLILSVLCILPGSVKAAQDSGRDMTSYITNPGFDADKDIDSGGAEGWTVDRIDGGNVTRGPLGQDNKDLIERTLGSMNYCFESWHCHDFDVWQELSGLPAGVYSLTLQGYVRCEAPNYNRGDKLDPARIPIKLYMNDYTTTFPSVYSESLEDLGHTLTQVESWTVETINDKQYPNSMGGASLCFSWGMYKLELIAVVNPGETVRIGVRGKMDDDWWCIWDNFQLTYLGSGQDSEPPTKIGQLTQKQEMEVTLTSELGRYYEGMTANVDVATILQRLGVGSLNDVNIYAVQSDGSLDSNYGLGETDGWRDANGDWKGWSDEAAFYVKSDFTRSSSQLYEVGGYPGKTDNPITYEAKYAFVAKSSPTNDAVILKVRLNYIGGMISMIKNPNFDNASNEGWLGNSPNMVGAGDHGPADVAEFWNTTFNTYQDLNDLPDGTYALRAKTAFRGSWEDFQNNREAAAKLYATVNGQTVEVPFNNMWSCKNTEPMGGETYFGTNAGEQSRESDGITYYIPNDPSAFRLYSEKGFYDTTLFFEVTGGTARIGVKNESMCDDGCDNWSCFDSFTLTYFEEGHSNDLNDGKYYLKNVATGLFWGAANKDGVTASLVKHPEYVTLHKQSDGTYTMETQYAYGENWYFNGDVMDQGPLNLTIESTIDGYFTISRDKNSCFGYDGTSSVLGKNLNKDSRNAYWQILNEAEMQATLNEASAENPIDATFYITNPNFSRNHRSADAWTMEAENQNLCGGEDYNRCAESWHSTFTLRQQIKNVPNGYYGLIAQGFYRQDGEDNDNLPYFYINDQHTQFLVKGELPDHDGSGWESMGDVSVEFSNGAYTISPIYVQVTDGTITLGARLENNTELWAIWDNFELYYYGDSKPFNDKTFVYNKIKYHTTSDETVEVVGRDGNLSSTVTIPAKVTNDGNSYTVTAIKAHAFGWIGGITSITIPSSILYIEDQAIVCCGDLKSINVNANNPNYCSVDGVLFTKDMKRLVSYPPGKDAVYYAIPEGVEILGTSCLRECQKLESITIPSSFKEIWWWPLEGNTNLTNVICMMEKPFMEEYGEYMFDPQIYEKATLWVPQGCLANYQSRSPWNKFKAIKETPSQITVTAKNCQMEYGDDLPTLEFTTSSGPLTGQPKITCSATKKSKAGTYDIIIEQGTLSSPIPLRFVNGTLTINKAPLTVSVSNYTKKQGDPLPTFTVTYSGFKNGENENSLTKKPTVSCSATATSAPSTYTIRASGAESPNYSFTYKNGTLTVTKADDIVITAKSYTINYGDKLPTFEYTVSGGELKGTPSITCSAGSRPDAGVYDIVVSKGSVSNYSVSYVKGTLTVNKAPLTVSVGNYSRKEGEKNPTFNISYSGFKWSDTENSLTKKATTSCSATATSTPSTYTIRVSGAESPNYSFTYKNGTLTVIAVDAIAVKGKNYTITYGESVPNLEYIVEGGNLEGKPSITCNAGSHPAAGIYDIIVSKGSVANYKVSYVNGTLTVKKAPLTISVDNCSKYKGEENPNFNIKYDGFKWSDNANSLTAKPTVSCEANQWSPAGTYPITLSGAESPNYDFKYVNGTLTVKDVFKLTITPMGNGLVTYNGNFISKYSQFDVNEGEAVKLTFVPDDGYRLESFTLNGEDATKSVYKNAYTIYRMSNDINILVTFGESQGDFQLGNVRYRILSASSKTVVVEKSTTYSGHLVIPMSVKYDGTDWSVVGVDDNAFNYCTSLISVELPQSLVSDNVGNSLFVGCSSLAAIIWNPDYAMTNTMLGVVDNPNLLFYAGSSSYVPSGIANTVVDGKAKSITLQDVANGNGNFYCPKAFTANTITYTHNYTMESAINGIQGWETLALPFDVQKIEHSREGTIVPFIKYHRENADERPFWLYTYGSSGFERSEVIAANHAYIICMPNNSEYDSEYRLNGQVTFSSQNVTVESSSTKYTQRKSDKELCPAFCLQEKSANVYALNVTNDLHGETGNRAPGSAFISNLRDVSPFEAYMTTTTGGSRLVIDIEFDDATGIGFLSDYDIFTSRQYIYSLTGQLVYQGHSREEFQKVLKQLPAGVYIINGRKQQIKK